jgi:hypothetical protein
MMAYCVNISIGAISMEMDKCLGTRKALKVCLDEVAQ